MQLFLWIQAYRQLNKAAEMMDIEEGIGTHTLRKTFGYWHYKQFRDVAELQKILNHSHPEITLRYLDKPVSLFVFS
jgi:integrase